MDLLQHLVDVDGVRFLPLGLLLLVSLGDGLGGLACLLGGLSGGLGRHVEVQSHHPRSSSERPEICHCQKWYGSDLQALKD